MDMTIFNLDASMASRETDNARDIHFRIPTLPAYAIAHTEVIFNGVSFHNDGIDYVIRGDKFVWKDFDGDDRDELTLLIYFHGIKDFALLFPEVPNQALRDRLGSFYEEAELSFKSGAWLSYSLMCGAIFEGLLFTHENRDPGFSNLIRLAEQNKLVDTDTARVMEVARKNRNLVHASKYGSAYVTRFEAMEMRAVMDRLIKQLSKLTTS